MKLVNAGFVEMSYKSYYYGESNVTIISRD